MPNGAAFEAEPQKGVGERLRVIETWQSEVVDASIAAARVRVDQHRTRFAPFVETLAPSLPTTQTITCRHPASLCQGNHTHQLKRSVSESRSA